MMRTSELHSAPRSVRGKGQVREGMRYVRTVPDLFVPMVMVAIVGTLTFNFSVTLPLFVTRDLHGNNGTYTIVYSVLSLGAFGAALFAAQRKTVSVHHIVLAALGFGASMLLFAAVPNLLFAFPVALIVGFASVSFMTTATAIVQVRADPTMRGRVMALQAMVLIGSTPLGGPLLGWVCETLGTRAGLLLGAGAAFAAAAWGHAAARRPNYAAEPQAVATASA